MRLIWVSLAAILVVAAGATWSISASLSSPVAASAETDLEGNAVSLDPGVLPSPEVQEKMAAVPDDGTSFQVPSVGLDVPVGQVSAVDGNLTPPGFQSVYAVRNLGTSVESPHDGTVYVITHSLRGGGVAPGNYLIDVNSQKAAVSAGDAVYVDGVKYSVTSTSLVRKSDISAQEELWQNVPDRLAIITCMQKPSGVPSTDNVIVYATLDDSGAG